jgi:hypothetical protein
MKTNRLDGHWDAPCSEEEASFRASCQKETLERIVRELIQWILVGTIILFALYGSLHAGNGWLGQLVWDFFH